MKKVTTKKTRSVNNRPNCLKITKSTQKVNFTTVIDKDGNKPAQAISIDDECHLLVRFEDGTEKLLSSGEVSIKLD